MSILGPRTVILADGLFQAHKTKTAMGIIRCARTHVLAVIDSVLVGYTVGQIKGTGDRIPIVSDIREILPQEPTTLLLGAYPTQGILPHRWQEQIVLAAANGMDIVSWYHRPLTSYPVIAEAVQRYGARLWDVRQPPADLNIARGHSHLPSTFTVLTVGSDCAVGKMVTALTMYQEAIHRGIDCGFVATGQAGVIIAGMGVCIDNVPGDYMAGVVEGIVLEALNSHQWVIVEGQGSLIHLAFSGVTLALLHGARPDALILCEQPSRRQIEGYDKPIPPLPELIQLYESAASWVHPAPVVGISLHCGDLTDAQAQQMIAEIESVTGLPAIDCLRWGAGKLLDVLIDQFDSLG